MEEKKVEYIELIYDLIFVYIVGRNNELLHVLHNGFIAPTAFLTYLITALMILQIWHYTTLFINRYGENDKLMYIGIFVNMYLLYYMSTGVRADWQDHYINNNAAWALILINLAVMYFIRLRRGNAAKVWERRQIKSNIITLLIQAAMVLVSIPVYHFTGIPLSPVAMLFGIIMAWIGSRVNYLAPVEFNHLTERVMLYVVFTFGEMIIGIAGYFSGGFTANTVYFSLCAFLIVVGLFMSYGLLYDHIIDRDMTTNGTGYMMLHVLLILVLNHITAALEFMREPEVAELPKNLFLIVSFVMFFVLLYLIAMFSREGCRFNKKFSLKLLAGMAVFVALMLLSCKNAYISIAVTVFYIASVYIMISGFWKKTVPAQAEESMSAETDK